MPRLGCLLKFFVFERDYFWKLFLEEAHFIASIWLWLSELPKFCALIFRSLPCPQKILATRLKIQRLRKIGVWIFGSLLHRINSFKEILKLKQIFQKNKIVTGKTPLFVISSFCCLHSICLNIGFWESSFEWKWCVFNLSGFN